MHLVACFPSVSFVKKKKKKGQELALAVVGFDVSATKPRFCQKHVIFLKIRFTFLAVHRETLMLLELRLSILVLCELSVSLFRKIFLC